MEAGDYLKSFHSYRYWWMKIKLNYYIYFAWQRFFVNDKFYTKSKNDAPVFLQLGGEGEANPVWLKEGQVATNYGPHFKALLLLLEHRYYGKSFPTRYICVDIRKKIILKLHWIEHRTVLFPFIVII